MTRSSFYTGACSVLIGVAVYATALHVTPLIIASATLLCILAYSEYAHSTVRRSVDLKQSLSILVVIVPLIVAYLGTFTPPHRVHSRPRLVCSELAVNQAQHHWEDRGHGGRGYIKGATRAGRRHLRSVLLG